MIHMMMIYDYDDDDASNPANSGTHSVVSGGS